jgi:hypothetical protein
MFFFIDVRQYLRSNIFENLFQDLFFNREVVILTDRLIALFAAAVSLHVLRELLRADIQGDGRVSHVLNSKPRVA